MTMPVPPVRPEMTLLRWLIRHRSWPSRMQRDYMSRNPKRRARVQAVADRILAEIKADEAAFRGDRP